MKLSWQNGFSGLDERNKLQSKINTAAVMKDFRINDNGSLEKRNEIQKLFSSEDSIKGLWCGKLKGKDLIVFISNNALMKAEPDDFEATLKTIGNIDNAEYEMFEFSGMLYIKGKDSYFKTDGETISEVTGYIPCVAINCNPNGSGEAFEEINLLCSERRQFFSGSGEDHIYRLAEDRLDAIVSIKVNGIEYDGEYNFNRPAGDLAFTEPLPEGLNNIEVVYRKYDGNPDRNRILGCTKIMLFGGNSDGRAFLWGNEEFPNYRFHSELADGVPSVEYFPVNAFTIIGNSRINCIVQQYDKQLIFNENEAFYSYCELRENNLGETISSFPVFNLNSNKGCLFETYGCVIDNKPVTLCEDGLNFWESTAVQDEKNAVCFSQPIWDSMKRIINGDKSRIYMFDHQARRELYFINQDTAYIYNYGNGCWYSFSGFLGEHYAVLGDSVYFSHDNSLYRLDNSNDMPTEKECIWETGFIELGENTGKIDIVGMEADVFIKSPIKLQFQITKNNGENTKRIFEFSGNESKYERISFRPSIKRGLPFKLTFSEEGSGNAILYSLKIKTRNKERSNRNGIL